MAKFWPEWGRLIVKPLTWLKEVIGLYKTLGTVGVSFAGVGAAIYGLRHYDVTVPWWVLSVVGIIAAYLLVTAGMAWSRTNGLSLKLKDFYYDPGTRAFVLDIKNTGRARIKFQAQVSQIRGPNGQRLDAPSYTPFWRDRPGNFVFTLDPGHTASLVLLMIVWDDRPENRWAGVWDQETKLQPLTCHQELFRGGPLWLDVAVSFHSEAGEFGGVRSKQLGANVSLESLTSNRV